MSQKEYTKHTEKGIAGAETYHKDVDKSIFILEEWFPASAARLVVSFCICVILLLAIHIYFVKDFIIKDYILSKSFPYDLILPLFLIFIGCLWDGRKEYRLLREKPYALISDEKLTLRFGKDSFLWDHIQSVDLEGERKLIVVFKDNGKRKKRIADLKWLLRKKDFIDRLKKKCVTQLIHYRESKITFSSRAGLFFKYYFG